MNWATYRERILTPTLLILLVRALDRNYKIHQTLDACIIRVIYLFSSFTSSIKYLWEIHPI